MANKLDKSNLFAFIIFVYIEYNLSLLHYNSIFSIF